jgi:hypothetical protein
MYYTSTHALTGLGAIAKSLCTTSAELLTKFSATLTNVLWLFLAADSHHSTNCRPAALIEGLLDAVRPRCEDRPPPSQAVTKIEIAIAFVDRIRHFIIP